jgi:hypothetical protein
MNRFDIALNRLPLSEVSALLDSHGEIAHIETERILVLGDGVREKVRIDEIVDPLDGFPMETEPTEKVEEIEEEPDDALFDYMLDDAERTLQSDSAIKYLNFIQDKERSSTLYKFERTKGRRPNFFFNSWEEFQCKGLKTRAHALYLNNIMNYKDINPLGKASKNLLSPNTVLNWASNLDKVFRIVASCDKEKFMYDYRSGGPLTQLRATGGDDWEDDAPITHRVVPDRVVYGKVSWLVRILA